MRAPTIVLIVSALAGCRLGGEDIDEAGEPCSSDLDCPDDMECVVADSPNATRVCMPLEE